jgi:CRISPR/Cas system CSM-associated protein Csm3 (group 7 of RAMP superfamily)
MTDHNHNAPHQNTIFATVQLTTVGPVTISHHTVNDLPQMIRGVDAEGRPLRTVSLPGATFRGRLRHEAAKAQIRRQAQVSLAEAYMLALGQDTHPTEDDAQEAVRLAQLQAKRDSAPLQDLFGSWKLPSRLHVPFLVPQVNVAPDVFSLVRRDLDSSDEFMEMLGEDVQEDFWARNQRQAAASQVGAQIKVLKRSLMTAKKAKNDPLVNELDAKIKELQSVKDEVKGDDESNNSKHLLQVRGIPAGVELSGRLVVKRARARDLMILIDAFDGLSRNPLMGGHAARGFGEVSGRVTFLDGQERALAGLSFGGFRPASVEWTASGLEQRQQAQEEEQKQAQKQADDPAEKKPAKKAQLQAPQAPQAPQALPA